MYKEALESARAHGGTIRDHFQLYALSQYEQAVHGYIRWIVLCSRTVNEVEDLEFPRINRFSVSISVKTLTEVMFKLVELVESKIADEMAGSKGALLFDGWSSGRVHYVGIYAS